MRVLFLLFLISTFFAEPSSAAKDSSLVTITFKNKVGNDSLELGKTYTNSFNEAYTVSRFKYYISHIAFSATNETGVQMPSYFLINEQDAGSKSFSVSLKAGRYHQLSFLIGVDSVKNVSGTQTDALDPMNGMFWTWNSGYIMAKLEGTSLLSKAPGNLIEYHIGGFRISENTVRKVSLSFPSNAVFEVVEGKQYSIIIEADINKWFAGPNDLKIAEHPACTTPGKLAVKYADNYAEMFKISFSGNTR